MDSGLKFELEIKKRPAQHLGLLLLNGLYPEFEDYISKSFFKHFWKSIFFRNMLYRLVELFFTSSFQ